jgi:hypothetical protein
LDFPENDGGYYQVESTGAVALILEGSVSHLAEAVGEETRRLLAKLPGSIERDYGDRNEQIRHKTISQDLRKYIEQERNSHLWMAQVRLIIPRKAQHSVLPIHKLLCIFDKPLPGWEWTIAVCCSR